MQNREHSSASGSLVRKVPLIGGRVEQFLSLLDQLGLKEKAFAVVSAAAIGIWTFVRDGLPWWGSLLLFLALAYFALGIIHRIQVIRATQNVRPPDFERIGERMIQLADRMSQYKAERLREMQILRKDEPPVVDDARRTVDLARWEADREFEAVTAAQLQLRFGSEAYGFLAFLGSLGVEMPAHLRFSGSTHDDGVARFLGIMGTMLRDNRLQEAIDVSKQRDVMWRLLNG